MRSDWLVFCDYGFSVSTLWCPLATPIILRGFLLPWTLGISWRLLQQSAASAPYLGWGISPHSHPSWPWTWSNRQIWPWSMEWSRAKANRVLQETALVIANTLFQQHKRRLYIWTSPDGQYRNQIVYIFCSQTWRSAIQSAKTRQRPDCGSDHELLIAKFRLKLKKVGKTTRPFRYDQIKSLMIIQWQWEIDLRD